MNERFEDFLANLGGSPTAKVRVGSGFQRPVARKPLGDNWVGVEMRRSQSIFWVKKFGYYSCTDMQEIVQHYFCTPGKKVELSTEEGPLVLLNEDIKDVNM